MKGRPTLLVVEHDRSVREALAGVARLMGLASESYCSGEEFLPSFDPQRAGCLLVSFELPGMNGLQVQSRLRKMDLRPPLIMLGSNANVKTVVAAMRNGAVTFLEKPFAVDELCREIKGAIGLDASRRVNIQQTRCARDVLERLTPKELEVLENLANGLSNKQIASRLGRSIRAVEDRRSRMMKRLGTRDLSEALGVFRSATTAT